MKVAGMLLFGIVLLLIGTNNPGLCYDTGHHTDLVVNAMVEYGFNNNSMNVARITNWMVDYFSYTIFSPIEELNALHFDNIASLRNVSNYFNTLAINSRSAIQAAVRSNDVTRFLGLIGLTTHAVEDFYTHSSWVDLHQTSCNCYRDDTWFDVLAAVNGSALLLQPYLSSLATYSSGDNTGCHPYKPDCLPGRVFHGDYCGGINKDSYARPKWEASYSFAFAATFEWIYNVLIWADEAVGIAYNPSNSSFPGSNNTFVTSAKNYIPSNSDLSDLNKDVTSSIAISYASHVPSGFGSSLNDGHWKGPGSGSYSRLAVDTLEFERRGSIYHDLYQEQHIYAPITDPNPYFAIIGDEAHPGVYNFFIPYTEIPQTLRNFTKVKIRTTSVTVKNQLNTPSPYAVVTIDGQQFIEGVQRNEYNFNPHWTSVKFIKANRNNISIQYDLWNDKFPSSDDQYQLTPTSNTVNMVFNVYSHQLTFLNVPDVRSGVYNRLNNTATIQYEDTQIQLYALQQQQGNCSFNYESVWGNLFCPDEAYFEYLLAPICGDQETLAGSGEVRSGFMFWILSFIL